MPTVLRTRKVDRTTLAEDMSDRTTVWTVRAPHNPIHTKTPDGILHDLVFDQLTDMVTAVGPIKVRDRIGPNTVGHRQDGSKEKYLGLRPDNVQDGSIQLEFSIDKVRFKRNEDEDMQNESLDMSKREAKDEITFDYGDVLVRSTRQGVRQMIRANDLVEDFLIEYEIHATGLTYVYKAATDEYWFYDDDGIFRYRIVSPKILDENFQPVIGTNDEPLVAHTLYRQGNKLMYRKTPTLAYVWFNRPLGDFYIDADIVYSATNDGYVSHNGNNWNTVRSAATGSALNDSNTTTTIYSNWNGSTATIFRTFMMFNTSGLFGTVTAATVHVKGTISGNNPVAVQDGTQASTLTTADYDSFTGIKVASFTGTLSEAYTFATFTVPGLSIIDLDGTTRLCFRNEDYDYDGVQPSTAQNNPIYSADESGTSKDPFMSITTIPSVDLEDDLSLGMNIGITEGGTKQVDSALSLGADMNVFLSALQEALSSVSLGVNFTISLSVLQDASSSFALAGQLGIFQKGQAETNGYVDLEAVFNVIQSGRAQALGAIALLKYLSVMEDDDTTRTTAVGSLTLAHNIGMSFQGISEIFQSILFGSNYGVGLEEFRQIYDDIVLETEYGVLTSAKIAALSNTILENRLGIGLQKQADMKADLSLDIEQQIAITALGMLKSVLALSVELGQVETNVRDLGAEFNLSSLLGIDLEYMREATAFLTSVLEVGMESSAINDGLASLELDNTLELVTKGIMGVQRALSVAVDYGVDVSSTKQVVSGLPLNNYFGISPKSGLELATALTLTHSLGTILYGLGIGEQIAFLNMDTTLGIEEQSQLKLNPDLTMSLEFGVEATGVGAMQSIINLATDMNLSLTSLASMVASFTVGTDLGIAHAGIAEALGNITFDSDMGMSPGGKAVAEGIFALSYLLGTEMEALDTIAYKNVLLAMAQGIDFDFVIERKAYLNLAEQFGISSQAHAVAMADLSLDEIIAISVAGNFAQEAGLSLSQIQSITTEAGVTGVAVTTTDDRQFIVRIEVRSSQVAIENRIIKVRPENRRPVPTDDGGWRT